MSNDIRLFISITERLEYLTTYDEYGSRRSIGLSSYSELADDLNQIGIVPKRGHWSAHSLECFMSRLRKRYGVEYLKLVADCRFIGVSNWEWLSRTSKSELITLAVQKKSEWEPYDRYHDPAIGALWKQHEIDELVKEMRALKKICSPPKTLRGFSANVI